MKKLMVMVLVGLMVMSTTVFAFADETSTIDQEAMAEKRVLRLAKLVELFETYSPDQLDDFLVIESEHEAFHLMAQNTIEEFRETVVSEKESIRSLILNEDYSKEDIKGLITEFKDTMATFKENADANRANKKATLEVEKEKWVATHEAIKAALSEEVIDPMLIANLLNEVLILSENHIGIDYNYFDIFLSFVPEF